MSELEGKSPRIPLPRDRPQSAHFDEPEVNLPDTRRIVQSRRTRRVGSGYNTAYDSLTDLPPLVRRAISVASGQGFDFDHSCAPAATSLSFDLLVLGAGGKDKAPSDGPPLDPAAEWLAVGGTIVPTTFCLSASPARRLMKKPAATGWSILRSMRRS